MGKGSRAARAGDGERTQLARMDLRCARTPGEHRHRVAGHSGQRSRCAAFERDVREVDAGALLQHFHREVMLAAIAARRVRQWRIGLAHVRNEFLKRFHRHCGIDREHEFVRGQRGHRHQVLQRIEGHLAVKMRIDGDERVLPEQKRVAIGRRFGDQITRDVAVRAGAILDDHGLSEALGQPRTDHARRHVGRTARRNGHDDADGLRRIRLRARRGGKQNGKAKSGRQQNSVHQFFVGVQPV
jgi:hypothetical protein